MSGYKIEKVSADNFSMLIPLMKDCFGMTVNIDYFKWKYLKNPAGNFIGFVAIEIATNEVAAYYGVIPQKFIFNGVEQIIYQSCDTMTHSKHRRKGLFQQLALVCYDNIKQHHNFFIIGFGGGQSTPGFLKFGWKQIFQFKYYFKPNLLCKLDGIFPISKNVFTEETSFDGLSDLIEKQNHTAEIYSNKNLAHFNWRIANPNQSYKIISVSHGEKKEGYIVYTQQENKLILFDFSFHNKQAKRRLMQYLSAVVVQKKLQGVIAFCQENGEQSKILKQHFYISNPFNKGPLHEKVPFIIFTDDARFDKYSDAKKWSVTSYDHDAL